MKRLFLAFFAIVMSAALFAAEPAADTAKTKTKATKLDIARRAAQEEKTE